MSDWKVELQGEVFDIGALTHVLVGTTDTIIEEEGKQYLCSPDFSAQSNVELVRETAERILKRAGAFLKLSQIDIKPVTVGSIFRLRQKGQDIYVFPGAARILVHNVTPSGPNARGKKLNLALLQRIYKANTDVERALNFFANDDPTYRSIYLTYEIIRDELGRGLKGADAIASLASVDPDELRVFYENANNESLSGDDARHAGQCRSKKQPKVSRRMPVEEARELIGRILITWIQTKI